MADFRDRIERMEKQFLNSQATQSYEEKSTERDNAEELPEGRTPFQRDRDRIIHSKAFRRLMHKTQVFIRPDSEHLRTRLSHTMEVEQIARTIARRIGANEDLTEAIALGHDLGHTPFGHLGEEVLKQRLRVANVDLGFTHHVQSWRIVSFLERYWRFPKGLNLTRATRFGILRHSGKYADGSEEVEVWDDEGRKQNITFRQSLEEKIVRVSDDIAWLNHDWDDGVRSALLAHSLLGQALITGLGTQQAERINVMIGDVVRNFSKSGTVAFSSDVERLKEKLKTKLDRYLWSSEPIKRYNEEAKRIIGALFDYFLKHPHKLPDDTRQRRHILPTTDKRKVALVIADYISGMTDDWCLRNYETFIYSRFSRFKELEIRQGYDWVTIRGRAEKVGQTTNVQIPQDLDIPDATVFRIFEPTNSGIGKEKGKARFRVDSQVEITEISQGEAVNQGDILVISD